MSHVIEGLAVKLQELPPRGDFTGPAQLVTLVDDDAGEVFALMATDEAAATLAGRELPCRVRTERARHDMPDLVRAHPELAAAVVELQEALDDLLSTSKPSPWRVAVR